MLRGMRERRLTKQLGRPPIPYDAEIAEAICEEVASSTTYLQDICKSNPLFPCIGVVRKWLINNDDFNAMYMRALEQRMLLFADEVLEISDNANADVRIVYDRRGEPRAEIDGEAIRRSQLRAENRKWLVSKFNRKIFGDNIDITSGGAPLPAPAPIVIDARVQSIMLLADERRRTQELLDD